MNSYGLLDERPQETIKEGFGEDVGTLKDNFNPPLGSIDGFYERMERIDAVSLSLGLRLGEFIMRDCLPAGRWTLKVLEDYTRSTSWLR